MAETPTRYCTNGGERYQEGQDFRGNYGRIVTAAVPGPAPEAPRTGAIRGGDESLAKLAALLGGIGVIFILMIWLVSPYLVGCIRGSLGI